MTQRLPERIEGDGFVLRRQRVDDAEAIARAVGESLEHLRPWMPWATEEAATVEAQRDRLIAAHPLWEAGRDFGYAILTDGETTVCGVIGLHARLGRGALEIGYWLHPAHTGRGIMTMAARLVTQAALALPDVTRVEIHCDEANASSAAIPARLGYRLDRIEQRDVTTPAESGRHMVWVLSERSEP